MIISVAIAIIITIVIMITAIVTIIAIVVAVVRRFEAEARKEGLISITPIPYQIPVIFYFAISRDGIDLPSQLRIPTERL